jgi:hypothetical protein
MASMAVRHAAEYCEAVPGAILTLRDALVAELAARAGLGPPDLCWLRKTLKPPAGALPVSPSAARGFPTTSSAPAAGVGGVTRPTRMLCVLCAHSLQSARKLHGLCAFW